jgi:hypothetical protein
MLDKDKTYCVADSGANLSVISPVTAEQFSLTQYPWPHPFTITFGNNSSYACTQFVDLGPLIGKVAVVDNAPDTLLSISDLTLRGFEIHNPAEFGGHEEDNNDKGLRGKTFLALRAPHFVDLGPLID